MNIIKRSGQETEFDRNKVIVAINKAANSVEDDWIEDEEIELMAEKVEKTAIGLFHTPNVEEISDIVEKLLMDNHKSIAKAFITYRYTRQLARKSNTTDDAILALLDRNNEEAKQENSNKNPIINSTQRDYMAGEVSKDLSRRVLLPADVSKAHDEGIIHVHDTDYLAQRMHNCDLVNLEDMLQNGTVITDTYIETPKSFMTACNIATQIIAQVASNQYGGQTITLSHLAPFVDVSRRKIREEVLAEQDSIYAEIDASEWPKPRKVLGKKLSADKEKFYNAKRKCLDFISAWDIEQIVEKRLEKEIKAGVQTIQYQLITLMTTNGQTPFVSIFMYIDEVPEGQIRDDLVLIIKEVLRQRIKGTQNDKGVWVTPAFPKLLYVLDEDNASEGSKYWDVTTLAAECTAKRMVPDYISAKMMREMKQGDVYGCMGCRSFLTVDRTTENVAKAKNYKEGEHKYYGRFNQGVVTLNLVDIACSSNGDEEKFWEIMNERLELCHKALRVRHERLLGVPSDVAPILWQHGALARLDKGETIDKLLFGGYSTISLGYAGLYECVYRMKGASHTSDEAKPFAMAVMQRLNDACAEWKAAENIDYSVYGTPLESTTYKFAKALQKRFGIIPNVTDHGYITNSYHVCVREQINAFEKLSFEAPFQKLSPGGAISYVEVPDLKDNIPAVLSVIKYIYDNIMYAELNSKSDYCQVCGSTAEIQIVEDDNGKLVWECPCCKNRDQNKMNVARRTCGYIGSNFWNQGRTQEIKERVIHLSQTAFNAAS